MQPIYLAALAMEMPISGRLVSLQKFLLPQFVLCSFDFLYMSKNR